MHAALQAPHPLSPPPACGAHILQRTFCTRDGHLLHLQEHSWNPKDQGRQSRIQGQARMQGMPGVQKTTAGDALASPVLRFRSRIMPALVFLGPLLIHGDQGVYVLFVLRIRYDHAERAVRVVPPCKVSPVVVRQLFKVLRVVRDSDQVVAQGVSATSFASFGSIMQALFAQCSNKRWHGGR